MGKLEMVEELKRSVLTKVQNREGIPENVMNLIENSIDKILDIYQNLRCDTRYIEEYIDGNKNQIKSIIEGIGEDRKSQEIGEIDYIIRGIQREIEEKEENKRQHEKEIEEIQIDDNRYANRIIDNVTDCLKDIQSHQNRILSSMGYTDERIQQINQYVNQYIYNVEMRQGDKINELLNADKEQLISQVLEQYEEFHEALIKEDKDTEKKEDIEHQENKQESFREELSSGKSLEEQREYVNEILKQEKEKSEMGKNEQEQDHGFSLPGDVII